MKNETTKEKRIRQTILLLSIFAVIAAFVYRNEKIENLSGEQMKAVVIRQSESMTDNPVIAMYRSLEERDYIVLYQIVRQDKNHFKSVAVTEINGIPERLLADQSTDGVWIKLGEKWVYYNEMLIEEKRKTEHIDLLSDQTYPFSTDGKNVKITVNNQAITFNIQKDDQLEYIFPLSKDGKLLLAVFKDDVRVVVHE